ncbi:MAG TPA: radical SAM protein [Micromonosporaceae bacterium]|nr:radical SAM protein [Micromonosporaceae bacterium]
MSTATPDDRTPHGRAPHDPQPGLPEPSEVETFIAVRGQGFPVRNNAPMRLMRRSRDHLDAARNGRYGAVPPPLCVQVQVSDSCPTHCVMCDKWFADTRSGAPQLTTAKRIEVIAELGRLGVGTVVISGGEPLMNPDLPDILAACKEHGLAVGLLTSATVEPLDTVPLSMLRAIRRYADWVAVSVDGTEEIDAKVRLFRADDHRSTRIRSFCEAMRDGGPSLSATVTLQKQNINADFDELIQHINDLGFEQVTFKLATGLRDIVSRKLSYLAEKDDIEELVEFLYESPLADVGGNNLDYLRRCFAEGVFTVGDTVEGGPVRTFYSGGDMRCFTPFLFALVDTDGSVYPCCHLFRDNHGRERSTVEFRRAHHMGTVATTPFAEIWNGEQYQRERRKLEIIRPEEDFAPCAECTRHCQQNKVLSRALPVIDELLEREPEDQADASVRVWL